MKITCSIEVTDEYALRDEARTEFYVHRSLTNQIADKLSETLPKSVERVDLPIRNSKEYWDPYRPLGSKYKMEFYVFTDEEMGQYNEDLRRKILFDMAADRAMRATELRA